MTSVSADPGVSAREGRAPCGRFIWYRHALGFWCLSIGAQGWVNTLESVAVRPVFAVGVGSAARTRPAEGSARSGEGLSTGREARARSEP